MKNIQIYIQDVDEPHARSHSSDFISVSPLLLTLNLVWMKFEIMLDAMETLSGRLIAGDSRLAE
jgi:hypothetical protein